MKFEELTLEDKLKEVKQMFKTNGHNLLRLSYTGFYERDNADNLVYKIYTSTNENLNYYEQLASFKNKDVLVPTASGDHALNAILFGAKSVETFDINSIAKYHSDLKFTAIQHLTREEFLKFYNFYDLLNKETYDKFRSHLQDETKYFFDEIYKFLDKEYGMYWMAMSSIIEEVDYNMSNEMKFNNPYLKDDDTYKKLQSKLKTMKAPIKHKICPADELLENFDKKDIIIMSNIYSIYLRNAEMNGKEVKPYIKEIPQLLNDNGTASLNYLYAATSPNKREILETQMEQTNLKFRKINITPKWTVHHSYDVVYAADKNENTLQK